MVLGWLRVVLIANALVPVARDSAGAGVFFKIGIHTHTTMELDMEALAKMAGWATAICGAIMAVMGLFADGRAKLGEAWSGVKAFGRACKVPFRAPWAVMRMERKMELMETELSFNGGSSLKDVVTRAEGMRRHHFAVQARPAFMCIGSGEIFELSDALCQLCGVWDKAKLYGHNWLVHLYVEDVEDVQGIMASAAAARSAFRLRVRIREERGDYAGLWEVIANVILDKPTGQVQYAASFKPADDVAKKIVKEHEWRC